MNIKIRVTDLAGVEQITVLVADEAEKNAWLAMIAETARFGKPERWVSEIELALENKTEADALDVKEVEMRPAMNIPEVINMETGEVQAAFTVPAETRTEYLLPAEYEITITDISEELDLEAESLEASMYLKKTDWYVVRFADSGEPIPEDVKTKRAAARLRVRK